MKSFKQGTVEYAIVVGLYLHWGLTVDRLKGAYIDTFAAEFNRRSGLHIPPLELHDMLLNTRKKGDLPRLGRHRPAQAAAALAEAFSKHTG